MEFVMPIYKDDYSKKSKTMSMFTSSSISIILNFILVLVLCLFILCALRFFRYKQNISVIASNTTSSLLNKTMNRTQIPRKTSYYDFEAYLNQTAPKQNLTKNRRYFYVDLGCFDGRDTEQFIHFHLNGILEHGKLYTVAFEPDPINFSGCQASHRNHPSIEGKVLDAAAWTSAGEVQYVTEKGQKSRVDLSSLLSVRSIDFSQWLYENFHLEDYVYVKFTIEGAEIPILEKMVLDESLKLVDRLEIEWNDALSPDLEPRRVALECMFDNFGMDYLYMTDPVNFRHVYASNGSFDSVVKEKNWRLNDTSVRFHYKTRREVPDLMAERLKRKQQL